MLGQPFWYADFSGGLDTKSSPDEIPDNAAYAMSNVISSVRGALLSRNGNTTFSSPATTLTSLAPAEATPAPYLLGVGGTKGYAIDSGGTSRDITGAVTITTGSRWEWVQAPASGGQGPVWGMNGVDTPLQWTGATNSTALAAWTASSGSVPNGRYCVLWQNHVWVAGVTAFPNRVYWSDVVAGTGADPRSWPAANVLDLDAADGDAITGLGRVGPYLLVFKKRRTYLVTDAVTGANRPLDPGVGCISHRSIVSTPHGTVWLTPDKGVYVTDGSRVEPVSQNVQPTLDSMSQAAKVVAAGGFANEHYYLAVGLSGATNDTVLDYDFALKSWWKHSNSVVQFASWTPTSVPTLYGAATGAGRVDQMYVPATTLDNGAAFTASWNGPWINPMYFRRRRINGFETRKRFREFRAEGSGKFTINLSTNFNASGYVRVKDFDFTGTTTTFGGTGTFGGSGTFGDAVAIQQGRFYGQGVANAWSVQVSSASPFELDQFVGTFTDRRD